MAAEKKNSPRPGALEEAEDGEEAAEAPLRGEAADSEEEAPDSPPPPPPGEAEQPPAQPAASPSGRNLFANDGSFLELFKKKMETTGEEGKEAAERRRRPASLVGKRRGGAKLALKTGMVTKKPKTEDEEILTHKGGAWAQYMAEVKKYKAHQCSDDDKTRPLVK